MNAKFLNAMEKAKTNPQYLYAVTAIMSAVRGPDHYYGKEIGKERGTAPIRKWLFDKREYDANGFSPASYSYVDDVPDLKVGSPHFVAHIRAAWRAIQWLEGSGENPFEECINDTYDE